MKKPGKNPPAPVAAKPANGKKKAAPKKDSVNSTADPLYIPIPENRAMVPYVKMGRPTLWTQELADEICGRIMLGEPVRQICLLEHMPCEASVYMWLARYRDFMEQYTRARRVQAERMADELLEIADDGRNDWIERENSRTGEVYVVLNPEAAMRSKLRIDARRWLMGKYKPKKYGDYAGRPENKKDSDKEKIEHVPNIILAPYEDGSDIAAEKAARERIAQLK